MGALRPRLKISGSRESTTATVSVTMEELYKIGERTQQAEKHEVEMSDFEKKLNFTQKQQEEFTEIIPTPLFCIKTKHLKPDATKVFLNICHDEAVPSPPPITETELQRRVEEAERDNLTVAYRVPISLGEKRTEKDNKRNECDVFDIVVNKDYLLHLQEESATYQIGFLISVAIQGIEEKYGLDCDRNWTMLKNRKAMGKPASQRIRKRSKNPKMEEVKSRGEYPEDIKVCRDGHNIEVSMKLPRLHSSKALTLQLNPDCVKLVAPSLYFLEMWLQELQIDHHRSKASFDCKTKMLQIVAP